MTTSPPPESHDVVDQASPDRAVADPGVADQVLFERELEHHDRLERRLLWKEAACIAFVALVVVARYLWLT